MRKKQLLILLLAGVLFVGMAVTGCRQPDKKMLSPLTISFLRVGKADAMILETGGKVMVIDAGEEDDGAELVTYLKERNLSQVDVLVITHYDKDHVGGADTLAAEMPIGRVLLPDYEGDTTEYLDFMKALQDQSVEPEYVSEPLEFIFGEAVVTMTPPASYEIPAGTADYDNNISLVTTISHGTNRLFLAGDIEKSRICEILSAGSLQTCRFLKVPHHGIYNTALEPLVRALDPEYAVICSSDKNPADAATLELLKKYGVSALETRHGNIMLVSDGSHLELDQQSGK